MALVPISGPALEPVSLSDAKAHLRVDDVAEDLLISSLITAARVHLEQTLGRALITQTWRLVLDAWPSGGTVQLAIVPLQSVSAVRVFDIDGNAQVIAPTDYLVDTAGEPARLVHNASAVFPAPGRAINGIEIDFVAGHGAAAGDVPQPLRQAVMLLVAHWYERREPVEIGDSVERIPTSVDGLIAPYRMISL